MGGWVHACVRVCVCVCVQAIKLWLLLGIMLVNSCTVKTVICAQSVESLNQ